MQRTIRWPRGGTWTALLVTVAAWLGSAREAHPAPRNVILIVADDVGRELGCYGHPLAKTPALDTLAARGTRFDLAFATTASCSPSRSVILTGRHNHATGQYGLAHADHHFQAFDSVTSLPLWLAAGGYRTAQIGKLHVLPEASFKFQTTISADPRSPVEMAEAVRGLLAANDPRPFFLYFCPVDAHRSGDVRRNLPGQPNAFGNRPRGYPGVTEVVYDPAQVPVPAWLPDTQASRAELAQYLQSISRLDQGLGRLLDILQETGRADDTLVIFATDNGPPFPGAKTTCYEPGLRLPLLVFNPDETRRGVVSQALVSWVDLAPTILDFAGLAPPTPAPHGRSLLPILGQERPEGWNQVFASHTFHEVTMYYPMRVVRTRQHKLIWNLAHELPFPSASDLWHSATWQASWAKGLDAPYGLRTVRSYRHRPRLELYDLESDPDERINLAELPEHAPLVSQLEDELRQFQAATADPWKVKWEYE